ncbi:VCBS repeat-containing protein [soil metagenome]
MKSLPALSYAGLTLGAAFLLASGCRDAGSEAGPARSAAAKSAAPEGSIESRPLAPSVAGDPAGSSRLFERVPPSSSGIDFSVRWDGIEQHLQRVLRLNPVGGICTGDYDGDGLPDIFVTSPTGGARLFRNLGDFRFEDATAAAGVADPDLWGTGATFVDIDNDGHLDLYVCAYNQPNRLYMNRGDGTFREEAEARGLDYTGGSMTMAFADIDNDGDLDGYLATTGIAPPPGTKFRVNFIEQEDGVEAPVVADEVAEYWQILLLPGQQAKRVDAGQFDHLYRNDGGTFTEITRQAGIDGPYFSLSATWWDYNEDNLPDLYVSNDYSGPDILYRNNGDGTFTDVLGETVSHTPWFSMGSDIGDVNNDGRIDLFATDMAATTHYKEKVTMGDMDSLAWFLDWAEPRQYMANALFLNTGTNRMLEAARMANISSTDWTWTPRLEDFDNDGRVDLFVTNGVIRDAMDSDATAYSDSQLDPNSQGYIDFWMNQEPRRERNLAFRNAGDLKFEPAGSDWGLDHEGVSFGAATADFDGDGNLDLVVSNFDEPIGLYRNRSAGFRRATVRLVGTHSNRFGLGATVRISAGGASQVRYLTMSKGWLSSNEPLVHFGLGDAAEIGSLRVLWPSGHEQRFENLPADHHFVITEPAAPPAAGRAAQPASPPPPLFQPASVLASNVRHREEPFDDFARQPLLPNKMSQLGPGLAWGDIDGDGIDDLFLGGARGFPGQILTNPGDGTTFAPSDQPALAADKFSEDMGALFFDADADGHLDLYVASGSSEADPGDLTYRDRLYLNDGTGNFSAAPAGMLPDSRQSTGVVAAADYDRDGDLDLFVGARQIPGRYPERPTSQLLRNDGGTFTDATPPGLAAVGLVTSAIWSDVDNDGWPDLLVTLDWGPVTLFRNDQGRLVGEPVNALSGWWNGIAAGDIDHDGDIDFVVTNFGFNTKYKPTPEKPEFLYYGDLDGSGKRNLVEAKLIDGALYPRRGFSCSQNAMPFIKEKLQTFHNFASSTLEGIYPTDRLGAAERFEVQTLATGLLTNDGTGNFSFTELPRLAQISPSFGVTLTDFDADGHLDCVLAQNFFTPQRETTRMDSGLGLFLHGDGAGGFTPVEPAESGIVIPGDQMALTVTDLDADGRPDLVIAENDGSPHTLLARPGHGGRPLAVRLLGKAGNPTAIGARLTLSGGTMLPQSAELAAGGSYLSQSSPIAFFTVPPGEDGLAIDVRWPDGSESQHPLDGWDGSPRMTLTPHP